MVCRWTGIDILRPQPWVLSCRCDSPHPIRQRFKLSADRPYGLSSLCLDIFDLLIIDIDMRVYIETWIDTLDILRDGGFNGLECPGNVTLDGE